MSDIHELAAAKARIAELENHCATLDRQLRAYELGRVVGNLEEAVVELIDGRITPEEVTSLISIERLRRAFSFLKT